MLKNIFAYIEEIEEIWFILKKEDEKIHPQTPPTEMKMISVIQKTGNKNLCNHQDQVICEHVCLVFPRACFFL